MTTTEARPLAPPTPTLTSKPPTRPLRRMVRTGGRWSEAAFWGAFGVIARCPRSTLALTTLVTAATPVTVGEVAGVVVGGAAGAVLISVGGSSGRGTNPLAIVPRLSTFRRRKRLVHRRWPTFVTDGGLSAPAVHAGSGRRKPRIVRITETKTGVRVHVYAANVSAGVADFRDQVATARNCFGCRDVAVNTHKRTITLDLMWGADPLLKPISVQSLPAARKRLHVVVGLDELGNAVEKDMRLPNLVIGAPGAGKSTETWTTLWALQCSGIPFRVRVFDPKGGIELGSLKGRVHRYVSDPSSWDTFIGDAINDMHARQARQESVGQKEHRPTVAEPLDVMVVDELVTAILMGGTGSKVKVGNKTLTGEKAFLYFLSSSRASGFTLLASSQIAEKDVIGPLRTLIPYVSLLRVGPTETATVDMVLGSGARHAYPAHELDPGSTAGIGWVKTPIGIVRYRSAHLTDAQRRQVARRMGPVS